MKLGALALTFAAACGSTPSSGQPDAALDIDARASDAATDAVAIDAFIDAPLDTFTPPSGPLSCPQPPCTMRVSVSTSGAQGIAGGGEPSVSGNGLLVAFSSLSPNLVGDDQNGHYDLFVRDLSTDTTTRVVNGIAGEANGRVNAGWLTPDGRYIAFSSGASNLVSDDTNGVVDTFLLDRQTASITRISVTSQGGQATGGDTTPAALSGDARYVLLGSEATNLAPVADTNGSHDMFLRDRTASTTHWMKGTNQPNAGSLGGAMANDGSALAFYSSASNIVEGDANGKSDVFVRDNATGEISVVSRATDGTQGNEGSYHASLSADGRLVAFESYATNLIVSPPNTTADIFVRDRGANTTTMITRGIGGVPANASSWSPQLSADGRYVVFVSAASNLVPDDTNNVEDAFLFDRMTNTTTRVSVGDQGQEGNGLVLSVAISASGNAVVFHSSASNLVPNDTNNVADVFVRYLSTPATVLE